MNPSILALLESVLLISLLTLLTLLVCAACSNFALGNVPVTICEFFKFFNY